MSKIVWGKTHCARCGKPNADDAEADRYYAAQDAKDKTAMKELEKAYCWYDFDGEDCLSDKEQEAAWIALRNEIDHLRALLKQSLGLAGHTAFCDIHSSQECNCGLLAWRDALTCENVGDEP